MILFNNLGYPIIMPKIVEESLVYKFNKKSYTFSVGKPTTLL